MSSPLGPMASSIINHDAVQGETFLPGQIFIFGGFALRANSLGHLEQIESYALAVRSDLEVWTSRLTSAGT